MKQIQIKTKSKRKWIKTFPLKYSHINFFIYFSAKHISVPSIVSLKFGILDKGFTLII